MYYPLRNATRSRLPTAVTPSETLSFLDNYKKKRKEKEPPCLLSPTSSSPLPSSPPSQGREPNHASLRLLQRELNNGNALQIHSRCRGRLHGHLAQVVSAAEYKILSTSHSSPPAILASKPPMLPMPRPLRLVRQKRATPATAIISVPTARLESHSNCNSLRQSTMHMSTN